MIPTDTSHPQYRSPDREASDSDRYQNSVLINTLVSEYQSSHGEGKRSVSDTNPPSIAPKHTDADVIAHAARELNAETVSEYDNQEGDTWTDK